MAAYAGPHLWRARLLPDCYVHPVIASMSGRGGRWPVRTTPRRRGCWPCTLTAIRSGGEHSWMPCAARSVRGGLSGASGLCGGRVAGQPAPSVVCSPRR
jgi:hypothetical protein